MATIDVEPSGGTASARAFFDLDRTNSVIDTDLDRDNLQAEVESTSTGSTKGFVTITFPPSPGVTVGDPAILINLFSGRFSSDAFVLGVDVFGATVNFAVSGGKIGGAWDFSFSPRDYGVSLSTIQAAVTAGFVLVLKVADSVTSGVWGSWQHVYVTLVTGDAVAPYVPPTTAHPSLRMLQRGGTGGMSGIWRMVGNPTTRDSLRRGPGSIL